MELHAATVPESTLTKDKIGMETHQFYDLCPGIM